jgi:hypothetical protein
VSDFGSIFKAIDLLDAGKSKDAIAALSKVTEGGTLISTVAGKLAYQDPIATAQWVVDLPESQARQVSAGVLAGAWTARDPAATAAWVEGLPAGATRDEALSGMIATLLDHDPEGASRWVPLFTDPTQQDVVRRIYFFWAQQNPAAAQEWVRNLPGVDDRWKARFLKQYP